MADVKPLTLTEVIILLSQQQTAKGEKTVQVITVNEHGQQVTLGVGAIFSVNDIPGVVFLQTTAVRL